MIDRTDIIQVADSIGVSLTEKQIEAIIATYPAYAAACPDNWALIVEDMIYDITDVMNQIPFDDSEERRDFCNDPDDDVNLNIGEQIV